ncbi:DUF2644 domain-containing protein [Mannheimia haemolytica]|uniref:DUF2644 domain-containing protein n=1 Tax=Mannheimia haemolytica TaxID=75985 RepID=UPI003CC85B02
MKQFLLDLITNKDGTASTTGFIQFMSWLVLSGILIHAYLYDKRLLKRTVITGKKLVMCKRWQAVVLRICVRLR